MAGKGPVPTPTALKILKGNPGRRPITKTEPMVASGIPDPPGFLTDDARAEWDRIAPELAAAGLLTALDRSGLAAYCVLWARVVACEEDLKVRGMTVSSVTRAGKPRAYPVPNPHLAILHMALTQLRHFGADLGLSPAARSRLQLTPPPPVSALEAFLRKHDGRPARRKQPDTVEADDAAAGAVEPDA